MEYLTIGKMAKLNNISEQTLRLYDKMGLLSPCKKGDDNGYRYYTIKQSAKLDLIQYMKSLGISLKDIKKQFDNMETPLLKSILNQKNDQINFQIKELKFQQRAIERTIESFERYENSPPDGTILLEYIPKRRMYCIDSGINLYDYGIEVYEKILRELKDRLILNKLPQIYFCNAGSILRQKDFEKRHFISTEVFVFVDKEFVSEELITLVPASTYLCIYCDKFEKEKEYAKRLMYSIEEKGYSICGDYICEAISDLPVKNDKERGMFLRLQIPIKF